MEKKINWITVVLKTILFCGLSIGLFFLNQIVVFFLWGSGETASRKVELPHVNFLFNYSPLILLGSYLFFLIIKYQKNNEIKFKTNIIVLISLIIFYAFKYNFLDLIML